MSDVFLQYGALGAITLVCLAAIKVMYNGFQKNFERERDRADRLEQELRALNEAVRTEYLRTLADATRAISDALAAVRRG